MNYTTGKLSNVLKPYKGLPKEVYIIFISRIINAMGAFVMPLLTLLLTKKIGVSEYQAGIWLLVSGILFLPASIIGGKLADSIGRKKVIIIFDSLAAMFYLTCVFVKPSISMIILIMFGSACMVVSHPSHSALLTDITEPKNREGAFSLTYMGFNLGYAIGPLLGGMLFENHLKLFFIIDALTAVIATILIFTNIKETFKNNEVDFGEDRILEKREKGSIISILLKRPVLLYFSLVLFGYNFVYSQWGFMVPMQIEYLYSGHGAELYGKLASLNGFLIIIFTPLLTRYLDKLISIRKIALGGILYVIAFGMLGYVYDIKAFVISIIFMSIGEILISISSMPFIANRTPASHRGRVNAIVPLIMGMGWTIGPFGMGMVLERHAITTAWKIIGVIMAIYVIFTLALDVYDTKIKGTKIHVSGNE